MRRVARKNGAELREYRGRGHVLHDEPGWPERAGDILAWLQTNVLAAGDAPTGGRGAR